MKSIKLLLIFLSFVVFTSCSKDDGKIDFTFLQLNDVYEIAPIQGGKFGGLARVETVHQELIKENPNTMLVMAGDFLNPSLLGTVKHNGERIRGKQMIETMNAMNFGLVAFGNHEFDISAKDLQKRLNESNFPWISSNVFYKKDDSITKFYKERNGKKNHVNQTFIKEFTDSDGTSVKIGFISVCIPSNPRMYVKYTDIFEEAKKSYESLKKQVDVVFGLTHVTVTQDKKILEMLPEIPLIMGGHEHTNMMISVGNSFVAKADANAKTAYIHRISFNSKTKKVTVNSELKEINDQIQPADNVNNVVKKWQTILNTKIKDIISNPEEVIYTADVPLEARDAPIRSIQTNMGELITKSMSFAFDNKVDCALVNGGSIRIDDVLEGTISSVDVFRVLPYGGAVLKVKIKGNLLKKVLDYGIKSAGTGAYLQRYNAIKKGNQWIISGKPINLTKTYTVAFSDYLLKGFDIPFLSIKNQDVISIYQPKSNEIAVDIRKALILFLKNKTTK